MDKNEKEFVSNNFNVEPNAQNFITNEEEIQTQVDSLDKREGIYNDLINEYKIHFAKKSEHNRGLKIAFFCVLMSLIALLIIGMITLCYIVASGPIKPISADFDVMAVMTLSAPPPLLSSISISYSPK